MKYKLVYIEWEDSLHSKGRWSWTKDIEDESKTFPKQMRHTMVGFVIKETKAYILLSQGYKMYEQDDGDVSVQDPFTLVKSAIRKRKVLKV
jgi:hypothetical protein